MIIVIDQTAVRKAIWTVGRVTPTYPLVQDTIVCCDRLARVLVGMVMA